MKIKPMLGDFLLEHLEYIESSESRALVEHRVPGLTGSYFQDMGTVPTTITIAGSKSGDEVRDSFLEGIRAIFNAGEPTTFVADINTATDLTEVVIEDLQVAEISGSADSFRYLIKLRKYIEPPEPPAAGLLDTSILDDAMSLVDALDAIDALSSISNLGDPTPPVRQALDAVKVATGGLDSVVNDLNGLFAKDLAATPALPPEMGEIASPPPVPPAEELRLDPADPRIDAETGTAIQRLLEAPETAAAAATLVRGVQGGAVAGILGEDAEAARQLAAAYGTQPSQLIPAGQDAALVLDPASPLEAPPTILLRSGIGGDPARLGAALAEVGRTFDLFQLHEVGPCDSTAAAIPVQNLVPSTFCQVPAPVPGIPPGPTPEVEPVEIDPAAPDLQIDPADPRIDVGAKFALQRMIKNPGMAVDASCLIRGINGGTLAGIYGDDLAAAVKVARAHGTERWLLVPKGEDAALVLDATAFLDAPPTVIFRGDTPDIRPDHPRIDAALQKAGKTFALFVERELVPCNSSSSVVPVPNLIPSSFCRALGSLVWLRLCTPTGEPIPGAPFTVTMGLDVFQGVADSEGFLMVRVPTDQGSFVVNWADPNATNPSVASFTREVFSDLGSGDEADHRRLVNLGYLSTTLQEQLDEFRVEFGRPQSVSDGELQLQARAWHDGGERPQPSPESIGG